MYFNKVLPTQPNLPACPNPDFRLRIPGSEQWRGFKDAVANPASNFGYWAPASAQVANVVFARTVPRMFDDVHPIHPFAREPGDVDYSPWIHTVAAVGLMPGCGTQPPRFCPGGLVSRAEAAMVLLRAAHGAGYVPPPATGRMFDDVDRAHPQVRWIERLVVERGVAGCQRRKYCPDDPVTRAELASLVLRARHGARYTPPAATGSLFADVPRSHEAAAWIERFTATGIRLDCERGFCPDAAVRREELAMAIARAFAPGS